jgi:cytidine deaminase
MKLNKKLRRKKNKKKTSFDLIVIRVSKTGVIGQSKPCYHCLQYLNNKFKYKIKYIYYSVKGGFIKIKFDELLGSPNQHISWGNRPHTHTH